MVFQPTQFGKYYLTRRIAVGGMAEIFQAKLFGVGGFEKPMVVKQILPQYARNAAFINMFIDEAKIAVTLTHGNIVPVYELGRIGDTYFIAMEYVPGHDLAEILEKARAKNNPVTPEHAAFIAIELCKGLDYAHRRCDEQGKPLGVVHRDVSPPNVLLSMEGQVKITDFGIAKAIHKLGTTESGVVKGTFGYMSPEQVRGLPVDHRTDIFSTGILLHEMLTGRRLFVGKNDLEAIERVKEAQIPAPSAINSRIPGAVDPIVFKALAKDAADRYATANEFQLALSRFLFTSGTGATAATLSAYLKELFDDEPRDASDHEEILFSAFDGPEGQPVLAPASGQAPPPPRPSPVDNATHSYAVRPELEEATSVMEHPAPEMMGSELTPSIPTEQMAARMAQSHLAQTRGRAGKSRAPRKGVDVAAGHNKALGETRALPALTPFKTEEEAFSAFPVADEEGPNDVMEPTDKGPKAPEVPALRFEPQKDREGSRPATLPSIRRALGDDRPDGSSLEPEEEFPSADELASLADQLEEATTEPRVVAAEVVPKPPKLVPPTAAKQPVTPAEQPEDVSATSLAETDPSALPERLPEMDMATAPAKPDGFDDATADGPGLDATASSLQSSPAVHRVSPKQASRVSGVLTGTLRMFVEGLDEEQQEPEPSAHHPALDPDPSLSGSAVSLKVPRTIKPTTLGWIVILVVVAAAALFVIYKKTDWLSGEKKPAGPSGEMLTAEDLKGAEPEKKETLGNIRVTAKPEGASFFLYAGETPVRMELDRGTTSVLRVERDGFRTVYRTVKPEEFKEGQADVLVTLDPVGSGNTEEVPAAPELANPSGQKGQVTVKSDPPKAMVWRLVGQGTLQMDQVKTSKSHYFKVTLPGHRPAFVRISKVDFDEAGETYSTSVTLEPLQAAAVDAAPATPDAAAPAPKVEPKVGPKVRRPRRPRRPHRPRRPRRPAKKPHKGPSKKISVPSWAQ